MGKVVWTGQLLVQESVSRETHMPIPIDNELTAQTQYFHTSVSLQQSANVTITLPFSVAKVLYVKGRYSEATLTLEEGDPAIVGCSINGAADINATELVIFNTSITALNVENKDTSYDITVEIAAVGA